VSLVAPGRRWPRILLGVVLAPLGSVPIIGLQRGDFDLRTVGLVLTFGYLFFIAFGLPVFWLFVRRGWRRWWHFLGAGLVSGGLLLTFFVIDTRRGVFDAGYLLHWSARYLVHVVSASLVFWAVAVRGTRAPAPLDNHSMIS
jgi:hypothetical protein